MTPRLLEYAAMLPQLVHFTHKKQAAAAGLETHRLLRVDCGLWGLYYLYRSTGGLRLKAGGDLPFHTAHLHTGALIGRRDSRAADGRPDAEAWAASLADNNLSRLSSHQ